MFSVDWAQIATGLFTAWIASYVNCQHTLCNFFIMQIQNIEVTFGHEVQPLTLSAHISCANGLTVPICYGSTLSSSMQLNHCAVENTDLHKHIEAINKYRYFSLPNIQCIMYSMYYPSGNITEYFFCTTNERSCVFMLGD